MVTDLVAEEPVWDDGGGRDLVFLSYSRTDAVWAQRLALLLKPVVETGRLSLWIDTDLRAGQAWQDGIDAAIARSRAALLLVSAAYLGSEFIMSWELPTLIEQRVPLLPVLVGDCLWRHVPALAEVQWLHDPGRDGSLDAIRRTGRRNQCLRQICERLLVEVPPAAVSVRAVVPTPVGMPAGPVEVVQPVVAAAVAGRLVGVPLLPPGYAVRRELAELIAAVTATTGGGAVGVTGEVSPLGLHGQGGIGKSVLAAALARDAVIRRQFPDGIFWVTVGEHADVLALQLDVLRRLDAGAPVPSTVQEATERLRQLLAERRVLLVVDDVWTAAAAAALRVTGPRGRLLYTSRDPAVIDAIGAAPYRVDVLSADAARAVAAGVLDQPAASLPSLADRVFTRVGRVVLAVALLAAAVRGGHRGWADIDSDLYAGDEAFGQHPYANAFKAIQIATTALPAELYEALLGLAVFPPDTRVPIVAIARYWAHTRGRTPADTGVEVERLAAAGVLQHQDGHIGFHDLQYDYLLLHGPAPSGLHTALLDAYRHLLPPASRVGRSESGGVGWWRLPPREPYIDEHLVEHLRGAGLQEELRVTVTDPAYLLRRVDTAGVYAAEADLAQAGAVWPADGAVAWWRGWMTRHAHLLAPARLAQAATQDSADDAGATGGMGVGDVGVTFAAWLRADATGREHNVEPDRLDPLLPEPCPRLRWGLIPPATALVRALTGHTGGVVSVGWSPDGARLASGGGDRTVRVWEATSGRLLHTLRGHTGGVRAVGWSPDGSRLVSGGGYDGTVRVWEVTSGRLLHTLTGQTAGVAAVAWSPDGSRLVSGGGDGTLRVWEATSGRLLHILRGHTRWRVWAVAWSPDGSRLVSGGGDGTLRVWEATSGRLLHTLRGHTRWRVWAVAWSPDGPRLVIRSGDGTVRVWAVGWSPDGSRLASGSIDGTLRVWEATSGRLLHTLSGHSGGVATVGWSPDGTRLVSGGDETVRVWEVESGRPLHTLTGHTGRVWAVGWSPDGTRLVSSSSDRTIRIWYPTATQHITTADQHTGEVSAVGWSPDGTRLVSGGGDGTLRVWEATSGRLLRTLSGHSGGVRAVAWSSDGTRFVSGGHDKALRVWEATTGQLLHTLNGHTGGVRAVGWSPDGTRLISSGDFDGAVRVWEAGTGRLLRSLPGRGIGAFIKHLLEIPTGHMGGVSAVGWSPDGTRLISGGDDGTVRVWDAGSGRPLHTLTGHTWVSAVGWSPDGTRLVSGGGDGTVRVWDAGSGRPLHTMIGHSDGVVAVGWSPDGTWLVSSGEDASLILWSLHTLNPELYLQLEAPAAVSWTSAGIAVGGVNGLTVFDLR